MKMLCVYFYVHLDVHVLYDQFANFLWKPDISRVQWCTQHTFKVTYITNMICGQYFQTLLYVPVCVDLIYIFTSLHQMPLVFYSRNSYQEQELSVILAVTIVIRAHHSVWNMSFVIFKSYILPPM